MARTFYPYFHAIRRKDHEDWEHFRAFTVYTLCGLKCLESGNRFLVYDIADEFLNAPYKVTFYRDQDKPVSDSEDESFIKCPRCAADVPLALLGDLP